MVWHMFLIAAISLIGAIIFIIKRTFDENTEYTVEPQIVAKIETRLR